MSFGAAEWLAVISVVVGVVVAIQSARFARSERQQDELERVYSMLYHHCFSYGKLSKAEKITRMGTFFDAIRDDNATLVILYDVEPLYREAVEQQSTCAFEAFALQVEEYYLT
ncbi:hypothetical protein BN1050_01127 [Metalysinibacillus saudimassiliensis]|uniref:Uncharacterized protein n=1 Tax=Metalysinibacillus saudimassiliensis TaxID=1461583 RepID=A0A078M3E4_9BACL|nr:hypothetical protein BN1050_01127 [Metalysinibacillus saudimassiliensis]